MNMREFTEFVDHTAQELDKNQFLILLHSLARKVPEENREAFVELLKYVQKTEVPEMT